MKKTKLLLCLLLALTLVLPTSARAAGRIDLSRSVTLTLSCLEGDVPVCGASVSIYLVALAEESGELSVTDDFSGFNIDIRGKNDDAWRLLASTLEGYVLRDSTEPADSGQTDSSGQLRFPTAGKTLKAGLYLVRTARHVQDGLYYDAEPFMIMLPALDYEENDWIYDVSASPKFSSQPIPPLGGSVERRVLKVWKDDGEERRPDSITVQLLRDGEVYDTVVLSDENNWRHEWTGLDAGSVWNVTETPESGYSVTIGLEGVTFVITNTAATTGPDEPSPSPTPTPPGGETPSPSVPPTPSGTSTPTLPQTGVLWWPAPVLAVCGAVLVLCGALMKKRKGHE